MNLQEKFLETISRQKKIFLVIASQKGEYEASVVGIFTKREEAEECLLGWCEQNPVEVSQLGCSIIETTGEEAAERLWIYTLRKESEVEKEMEEE